MPALVFDDRSERGLAIAKDNGITENPDGSFSVPSQTLDAVSYRVINFGGVWVCDCPDYQNRADSIAACKHIGRKQMAFADEGRVHHQRRRLEMTSYVLLFASMIGFISGVAFLLAIWPPPPCPTYGPCFYNPIGLVLVGLLILGSVVLMAKQIPKRQTTNAGTVR